MATHLKSIEIDLTSEQLADLGKQQAHLLQDIGRLMVEKKAAADGFKAAISANDKAVNELTKRISRGVDKRDVEVDILLNTPEAGKKTFVEVATGKHVAVEDMTQDEQQCRLFDTDERPDPAASNEGEKPETPPEDWPHTPTTAELEDLFRNEEDSESDDEPEQEDYPD